MGYRTLLAAPAPDKPPVCPRDHRDLVIEELAHREVEHLERIASLEADLGVYREITVATLDALRDVTVQLQRMTAENARRREENRYLREEHFLTLGADEDLT